MSIGILTSNPKGSQCWSGLSGKVDSWPEVSDTRTLSELTIPLHLRPYPKPAERWWQRPKVGSHLRYIDNVSALSGFVRGNSKAPDVDRAAAVVSLSAAVLQCRLWYEYVESDANWSDGISRKLEMCPWCREQGFSLRKVEVPLWPWLLDWHRVPSRVQEEVERMVDKR